MILSRTSSGAWLVTNRHVVDGETNVCVRTPDGRLWLGVTVLPKKGEGLDLAFLWVAGANDLTTPRTASAPSKEMEPWPYPIVKATGYPVRVEPQAAPPAYQELTGLLLPLLTKPLEGGLQLATTAAVRKGMSGGGLFDDQGRLIGLNTTHADPLWQAPLREEGGKPVPSELNRKLELVALAIPLSRILPLIKELQVPAAGHWPDPKADSSRRSGTTATTGKKPDQGADKKGACSGPLW